MNLEGYLASVGAYRRNGQNPTAEADFVAALKAQPILLAAARAELQRCTPDVKARCFGSRLTATILTDIFKQM